MKCPACHQLNDPELEVNKDGEVLRLNPRRACLRCGQRLVLCYDSIIARFRWREDRREEQDRVRDEARSKKDQAADRPEDGA